jgi:hypothetical protein
MTFIYPLLVTALALHVCNLNALRAGSYNQNDKASQSEGGNQSHNATAEGSSEQNYPDRIFTLIASLQSPENSKREDAERELVRLALTSSDNRGAVINALLKSVESIEELNGSHSVITKSLPYWSSVTTIFAKVKATEAINILIRCVHCSNVYTGAIGEPPASIALIQIGAPAIPRLSEALLTDPNGYKRVKIALCARPNWWTKGQTRASASSTNRG